MNKGRLIAVVGASGVGKDSVISGIRQAVPSITKVRRTITRAADTQGENHLVASVEQFDKQVIEGAFCLHWTAHGYRYGISTNVLTQVANGEQCLVNLSRRVLHTATDLFPSMIVLNITVSSTTLARRLEQRGRETTDQIAARLERVVPPLPTNLNIYEISNDGPLETTIASALEAIGLVPV